MTKEQIEQKAKNVYMRCFDDDFEYTGVLHALEICTEETATEATKELQKQIEIDAKQIRALQKQNGELTDKVTELEAQIEKMKCCENCKYYNNHYNEVVCKQQVINCKRILRQATRDQWEIKEK